MSTPAITPSTAQNSTLELTVGGMSCQHCVKSVTQAVQKLDPQASVSVDLPTGKVSVGSTASLEQVKAAIAEEGYDVSA
jgi:copper chaperone